MSTSAGASWPLGRLFWKVFIASWAALALASLLVGGFVWLRQSQQIEPVRGLDAGPAGQFMVDAAAAVAASAGRAGLMQLLAQPASGGPPRPPVLVVDAQGRELLGRPVPVDALAAARAALGNDRAAVREVAIDGVPFLLFAPAPARREPPSSDGRPPLQFKEGRPPPDAMRPPRDARLPPWFVPLATGVIASLLLSAVLAWYFAQPIRALSFAFGRAAGGDLAVRVAPSIGRRRDEVADLGRQFDRMVQRLDDLLQTQRRLFHDVSHELRSPLARLQVCVALARRDPLQATQMLDRIEQESARMNELIGEMLTLARLQAGFDIAAESEPTDVAALLAAAVDDARIEADAKNVSIAFDGAAQAVLPAQPQLLRRTFGNVLRNAVQHAPSGSTVEVSLRADADEIVARIADRGPGLGAAELAAVFEPFVRGRGGGTEGFGLGLAIAQRAVHAHRGRIAAAARDGGGLVVSIVLPR
jgi:two-component system OmpR family sensor kinase